ncbi:ABC transporter ATP-binding protein [Kroppenstedtia guangzhouensis]|uniref:ABC transporter ATP-binding protein n=2 Tax=Kroppenstedtia guangzhouensis TaxID=1274356 RepID=A0ABQ1GP69_9BACL|nr:ABC transporter ATP-binding protein [Kroppenstedtia guangzhouensis]
MAMIRVENLSFSYQRDVPVLQDITLDFDHRPTAIIGQNGAGKTTFVKLLKGLLKPDQGGITVGETDARTATAATLARQVGLVFQNPDDQIFKGNVLEEVLFGPLNIGQDRETARQNAMDALEMVGLEQRLEINPQDLSLSEKKLVCIAAVVAMDTDIVILDEPTIAQDHEGKERIRQIIRTLTDQGKGVLTIIHDMDFVAECFERTIVFNRGKVMLDGDTREIFSRPDLLCQAHLEPPAVARLGAELGVSDTFLTVEELVTALREAKRSQE